MDNIFEIKVLQTHTIYMFNWFLLSHLIKNENENNNFWEQTKQIGVFIFYRNNEIGIRFLAFDEE